MGGAERGGGGGYWLCVASLRSVLQHYVAFINDPLGVCSPRAIFGTEVRMYSIYKEANVFLSRRLLDNYADAILISGGASAPQGRVLGCLLRC